MKFLDPMPVPCDSCGVESPMPVRELLRLSAACPRCGASFEAVGREMRAGSDEWGGFCAQGMLALALEELLGEAVPDAEALATKTLRDFAGIVELRLPPSADRAATAQNFVRRAAEQVDFKEPLELDFDAPLMDALAPNRWRR